MITPNMKTYAIGVGTTGAKALEAVKAKELPEMQVLQLPTHPQTDQAPKLQIASAYFEENLLKSDENVLMYVLQLSDIAVLLDMLNSIERSMVKAFQTAIVVVPEHTEQHLCNEMLQPLVQKI
ncbi:MAG: hypothetical protein LPK21_10020, partial [Hymenobacteraceae bacterium]|nr:hypothetical protein [Hymenobacteraceae bacterium]